MKFDFQNWRSLIAYIGDCLPDEHKYLSEVLEGFLDHYIKVVMGDLP